MQPAVALRLDDLDDEALVNLARARDGGAYQLIMQRQNRRLYRIARSVLGDESEAEDAVQEAYLRAFTHLADFRGEARLSTWLTRIVLNEALGRLRQRRPFVELKEIDGNNDQGEARVIFFPSARRDGDPEAATARAEVRRLLEKAVDQLPDPFRLVFVLRDIEELSVDETASHLGLRPETVKTRLHRARRMLREVAGPNPLLGTGRYVPFRRRAMCPDHRSGVGAPRCSPPARNMIAPRISHSCSDPSTR